MIFGNNELTKYTFIIDTSPSETMVFHPTDYSTYTITDDAVLIQTTDGVEHHYKFSDVKIL